MVRNPKPRQRAYSVGRRDQLPAQASTEPDVPGEVVVGTSGPIAEVASVSAPPIPKSLRPAEREFGLERIVGIAAAIVTVLVALAGLVWYFARLDTRVDTATSDIHSLKGEARANSDQLIQQRSRLDSLDARTTKIERAVENSSAPRRPMPPNGQANSVPGS